MGQAAAAAGGILERGQQRDLERDGHLGQRVLERGRAVATRTYDRNLLGLKHADATHTKEHQ